jgi:recombination protein RecT
MTDKKDTQLSVSECKTLNQLLKHPVIQDKLKTTLKDRAPQFASALVSLTSNNKLLAKSSPQSVLAAGMQAAILDLPIQSSLGHAYVVPYKGQAQFQLGYKGLIQLALRSGEFAALNDGVVQAGQLDNYNELTGELKVDLDRDYDEKKDPDGYYCYFRLRNGFEKIVFWSHKKVLNHANRFSQSFRNKSGPWSTDFESMARKTVIKAALLKYAPLSVAMQKALETDQSVVDMDGNPVDYPDNRAETDESVWDVDDAEEGEAEDVPEEKAEPAKPDADLNESIDEAMDRSAKKKTAKKEAK